MSSFPWPYGARAALALTYDDCLPCHRETVAQDLHAAGIHGTFYAPTRPDLFDHAPGWAAVAAMGHELGNHTCFHPCRHRPGKNWGLSYELDQYSPARWTDEVELASRVLGLIDRRHRRTYGNTCHDQTIGPAGAEVDLRPLILERFAAGRGPSVPDGTVTDPWTCDLGGIGTIGGDGRSAADLLALIDGAIAAGGLLIVTFHAVGPRDFPRLHIAQDEHARLIDGIRARRADLWAAPLVEIADAVAAGRAAG